jgi:hypothetical protein
MKVNDIFKVNQENNNANKENLYQRFSIKEQNKNTEKTVIINFKQKVFYY